MNRSLPVFKPRLSFQAINKTHCTKMRRSAAPGVLDSHLHHNVCEKVICTLPALMVSVRVRFSYPAAV